MEVTKENFVSTLSAIKTAIVECDFICLDTEFTGISSTDDDDDSLFDSAPERYKKKCRSVHQFTLVQLGLACFKKDPSYNKYQAKVFNMFLFPRTFTDINKTFSCQVSALEFLSKNHFDFNKCIAHGVPFMSRQDAKKTCDRLSRRVSDEEFQIDEEYVRKSCEIVGTWLSSNDLRLEMDFDPTTDPLHRYMVAYQILKMFPEVKIDMKSSSAKMVLSKRATDQQKNSDNKEAFLTELVDELRGASVVFDLLVNAKKPLIGQNMLLDLLFLYEKFVDTLPAKYETFKPQIGEMFPNLYDTKQIALGMKRTLTQFGCDKSLSLNSLYEILENQQNVKFSSSYQPHVELHRMAEKYNVENCDMYFHEAGYDAYVVGVIFLRMAHMRAQSKKALLFDEHLTAVDQWKGRVNLIKAALPFVNFNGPDPTVNKPQWLSMKCRRFGCHLDAGDVSDRLAAFGYMDIKRVSASQALIAVVTHESAQNILEKFRNDRYYIVQPYSFLKHTKVGKTVLWASTITATVACIFLVTRKSVRDWISVTGR